MDEIVYVTNSGEEIGRETREPKFLQHKQKFVLPCYQVTTSKKEFQEKKINDDEKIVR